YNEEGGALSRLNYVRKLYRLARKTLQEKEISLVHCRSYLAALIGLHIKKRHKLPFIFDMRGFWADERIDGGIWQLNNSVHKWFYNYFKRKEKDFLLGADAIVSLTHAALKELNRQMPGEEITKKTSIIPCCTNTALFDPEITEKRKIEGLSENDHLVVYTGSVGTWYYTREMIDCVLCWKEIIPEIKLIIVTKDREELEKILVGYSSEQLKTIISASASYKEIPSYLVAAKASIFFIKPAYSKIASSPTKMAECWSMNLPIITNSGIGDNDLYFKEHQGGVLINDFTKEEYLRACRNYLDLKGKTNCRSLAKAYFDTNTAIKIYSGIYNSLCRE
ncbi:MAG: glycosyltransferase, partial [Bacteroidia bacterium]|nr:glycosyltransferase [Bacteroidia bacterium]